MDVKMYYVTSMCEIEGCLRGASFVLVHKEKTFCCCDHHIGDAQREIVKTVNNFTTCCLSELWDIRRTCWSAMSDDDRDAWQAAKDDKEAQELAEQKRIMRENRTCEK